jgi:hypothetical protein
MKWKCGGLSISKLSFSAGGYKRSSIIGGAEDARSTDFRTVPYDADECALGRDPPDVQWYPAKYYRTNVSIVKS